MGKEEGEDKGKVEGEIWVYVRFLMFFVFLYGFFVIDYVLI